LPEQNPLLLFIFYFSSLAACQGNDEKLIEWHLRNEKPSEEEGCVCGFLGIQPRSEPGKC